MKNLFLLAVLLGLTVSCAHHRDVRPGADGVHNVIVRTADEEEGSREAIAQANHFCEERKMTAAFIKESKKYTGDMDEKTYKNTQRITKVAKTVGGTVWALGGRKESRAGGVVGLGGAAGEEALGEGYTVEMKFKCL